MASAGGGCHATKCQRCSSPVQTGELMASCYVCVFVFVGVYVCHFFHLRLLLVVYNRSVPTLILDIGLRSAKKKDH